MLRRPGRAAVPLLRLSNGWLNELIGLASGLNPRLPHVHFHHGAHASQLTSAFKIHRKTTIRTGRTHIYRIYPVQVSPPPGRGEVEHYSA